VGRIVAICDVFDALTVRRPYKLAFPLDEGGTQCLRQSSGSHFDPAVVHAFFAAESECCAPIMNYGGDDSPDGRCRPRVVTARVGASLRGAPSPRWTRRRHRTVVLSESSQIGRLRFPNVAQPFACAARRKELGCDRPNHNPGGITMLHPSLVSFRLLAPSRALCHRGSALRLRPKTTNPLPRARPT